MTAPTPVLARFDRPVAKTETKLAVLSDLHLSTEDTGTWRVSHRTEDRLEATVKSLNHQPELDGVLFVGDLVQKGDRSEYAAFDRIVDGLEHPFVAIPGNHDLISWGADDPFTLPEFEERYTPGGLPFHERIGDIDVLALNSNPSTPTSVAETYNGRLDEASLEWLASKLQSVENPLVAVHHNLPGTQAILEDSLEMIPGEGGSPGFENDDDLLEVLAGGGAPLVVTGHVHFPAVTTAGGVREFTLPSLGPYPNAYTVLETTPAGTTARMHSVAPYEDRIESFVHGRDQSRVQITIAQLAGLPLVDDFDSTFGPQKFTASSTVTDE